MTASEKRKLNDAIRNIDCEKGNVRKLATQLTTILLEHQAGKNPYKLAWDIAKSVGKRVGANFKPADIVDELVVFTEELSEAPEYDAEWFREQGKQGSDTLTHEEHVKYGKQGAESYTNIGKKGEG